MSNLSNQDYTIDTAILVLLADPNTREAGRQRVAQSLAAKELLIFVHDSDADAYLPTPGFPSNLRNGKRWQTFLRDCHQQGECREWLELLGSNDLHPVLGVGFSNLIAVVVAPESPKQAAAALNLVMPLFSQLFFTEQQLLLQTLRINQAADNVRRSHSLTESLETARRKQAQALRDAQKARKALEEANQRKDEFLSILAHELRNPLAPIGNCLEILKLLDDDPIQRAEIYQLIDQQFHQMVRLIDDLMDVSRITRGKVELRLETVCLQEVIFAAIQSAKPCIEQQRHSFTVEQPEEALYVAGDKDRLVQVVVNLLNNAAKYTPPGGIIKLTLGNKNGQAVIDVTDNGVGLPQNALNRIFDMFVQLEAENSRVTKEGLGIGLTLVKQLVELHKGRVEVFSPGWGAGATFRIELPLKAASPRDSSSSAGKWAGTCSQLTVVIVDDNLESATTLSRAIRMMGGEVHTAHSGKQAIELIRETRPHLVFLDLGLPDISGYQVCQQLTDAGEFDSTVFIAQTGWSQPSDKVKSRKAGFAHHLVKPVDFEKLKRILEQVQHNVQQV